MNRLLAFVLIAIGAFSAFQKVRAHIDLEPPPDRPYIVVYGRDSCGRTQRMRRELTGLGLPYRFQGIDESAVADRVHSRMQRQGLDVSYYLLPVVEVTGRMLVTSDPAEVSRAYRASVSSMPTASR